MAQLPYKINNHYLKNNIKGKRFFYKRKKPPLSERLWDIYFHEDYNFLRYWRLIETYYLKKLDIEREDLYFLLYLAPKKLFSIEQITHYPLEKEPKHKTRIKKYVDKGLIQKEREGGGKSKAIYQPSPTLNTTIAEMYRRLLLLTPFYRGSTPIEMKSEKNNEYEIGNMPALFDEFQEAVDIFSNAPNKERDQNRKDG